MFFFHIFGKVSAQGSVAVSYTHLVLKIWEKATNDVTDALQKNLDRYNPIFMMADSGARGSMSQIRQLAIRQVGIFARTLLAAWIQQRLPCLAGHTAGAAAVGKPI